MIYAEKWSTSCFLRYEDKRIIALVPVDKCPQKERMNLSEFLQFAKKFIQECEDPFYVTNVLKIIYFAFSGQTFVRLINLASKNIKLKTLLVYLAKELKILILAKTEEGYIFINPYVDPMVRKIRDNKNRKEVWKEIRRQSKYSKIFYYNCKLEDVFFDLIINDLFFK